MATTPTYTSALLNGVGILATGNTARDGTGSNFVDLVTGVTAGTRIDEVRITATGTTTVGFVRLWHQVSSTKYLFKEVAVTAITPSASVAAFTYTCTFTALRLTSTEKLTATTHNTEGFHVIAYGANYT